MSYKLWNEYGYGICVDDVYPINVDNVFNLIHMAPNFETDFYNWIHETFEREDGITESELLDIEDVEDFENNDGHRGVSVILQSVIRELENISLNVAEDYDGVSYLLYYPRYPWNIDKKELNITEERLNTVFAKYVSVLTDKAIDVNYKEVECAG